MNHSYKFRNILWFLLILVGCKSQSPVTPNLQNDEVQLKQVRVNGEKLHYIEAGEGEALIFIHGTTGDYRAWLSWLEPLSKEYHFISYSRRYAHPNKQVFDPEQDYSTEIHAEDLYHFMKKLGLEDVTIMGHSYGALTALKMALEHPDLVKSLILAEPPATSLLEGKSESYNQFLDEYLSNSGLAFQNGENKIGIELFLQGVLGDEFQIDGVPAEQLEEWNENLLEIWGISQFRNFGNLDRSEMQKLNIPILLITGELSPSWFGELTDSLHHYLPKSEVLILKNSSHGLMFENRIDFDNAMMKFLKEN